MKSTVKSILEMLLGNIPGGKLKDEIRVLSVFPAKVQGGGKSGVC